MGRFVKLLCDVWKMFCWVFVQLAKLDRTNRRRG